MLWQLSKEREAAQSFIINRKVAEKTFSIGKFTSDLKISLSCFLFISECKQNYAVIALESKFIRKISKNNEMTPEQRN